MLEELARSLSVMCWDMNFPEDSKVVGATCLFKFTPMAGLCAMRKILGQITAKTLRCRLGCFCPHKGPPTHQNLESFFSVFFAALNLAVIGNVMGHAHVHTDCHLISCYASLYRASGEPTLVIDVCQSAARMRRNYDENLPESDKTDVANALFHMDTKLGACQLSHVLQSLSHF